MQFGDFLGNERLKERLSAAFQKGAVSHCFLISGPAGSGKRTLARILCAALECEKPPVPCLRCTACRKAMAGQHPDVVTVDDPEKRTVSIDLIRAAAADAAIRPNEGQKKIYLIPRAHNMFAPAQNALLKIIEEPPPYGVFLLLAENPDLLLPTVRSRCVELALAPLPDALVRAELRRRFPETTDEARASAAARSGGWLGQAITALSDAALPPQTAEFAAAFAARDPIALLRVCTSMEKWKRPELEQELRRWQELICGALAARSGMKTVSPQAARAALSRSAPELLQSEKSLQLALDYLNANVGPALICAMLSVKLR